MITLTEPYRLYVKYSPKVLIPYCAVDSRWRSLRPLSPLDWTVWLQAKFVTTDEKYVKAKFISTLNNSDGVYDSELDAICWEMYGMSFAEIKSVWMSRFPAMDGFWTIVELTEYANRTNCNNEQRRHFHPSK